MRYEVCIIKRTTWDITMLTCDVHKPPTQAIRSIFVADYTADELSVRAHSVFLYRSVERRRLGTVHGPAAQAVKSVGQPVSQSVSQSQTQLATTHIATGFLQFPYLPYISMTPKSSSSKMFPHHNAVSVYHIRAACSAYPLLNHPGGIHQFHLTSLL
jgi:hypothetical protein